LKPDSQYSGFLKPASVLAAKSVSANIDSGTAFGKVCICIISKCFHRSSLKINSLKKYLRNYEVKNVKISGPA
jgi:hypothetical protein